MRLTRTVAAATVAGALLLGGSAVAYAKTGDTPAKPGAAESHAGRRAGRHVLREVLCDNSADVEAKVAQVKGEIRARRDELAGQLGSAPDDATRAKLQKRIDRLDAAPAKIDARLARFLDRCASSPN